MSISTLRSSPNFYLVSHPPHPPRVSRLPSRGRREVSGGDSCAHKPLLNRKSCLSHLRNNAVMSVAHAHRGARDAYIISYCVLLIGSRPDIAFRKQKTISYIFSTRREELPHCLPRVCRLIHRSVFLAPKVCSWLSATRHKSHSSATKSQPNPRFYLLQSSEYPLVIKDITFRHPATVV